MPSTAEADEHVLLLPFNRTLPSSPKVAPTLVILVADQALPANLWPSAVSRVSSALDGGDSVAASTSFLFPDLGEEDGPASPSAAVASGAASKRKAKKEVPRQLHRAAAIWRVPRHCAARPMWDLTRPALHATLPEAAAAASALAAGIPFSEWFSCRTLEALRPAVRNLFRLPRRKGKSVWATCMRASSPCFWFTGEHFRGEHFVTQVLSSPDVLLGRMSAHLKAVRQAAPSAGAAGGGAPPTSWPRLRVVDPAAGDGNYTQHLPDGMGRVPPLALVARHDWDALLGEPHAETFRWLRRHFGAHEAAGRVALVPYGVTPAAARTVEPLFSLDAHVPELEGVYERGLPDVTRQRLSWGTSTDRPTPLSVRGDLWLFNHLAGGPVLEALEVNGHTARAKEFRSCKHNSASRRARCYNATVAVHNVTLLPWRELLSRGGGVGGGAIDLLVLNQRDPRVGELLMSFPLETIKPSVIYYRTSSGSGVRRRLLAHGYQTSAHWETSSWGEHTIAWRADRCAYAQHSAGQGGAAATSATGRRAQWLAAAAAGAAAAVGWRLVRTRRRVGSRSARRLALESRAVCRGGDPRETIDKSETAPFCYLVSTSHGTSSHLSSVLSRLFLCGTYTLSTRIASV